MKRLARNFNMVLIKLWLLCSGKIFDFIYDLTSESYSNLNTNLLSMFCNKTDLKDSAMNKAYAFLPHIIIWS